MAELDIIKGCMRNDKNAQKMLFEAYYSSMLGVCIRYSKNEQDAKAILKNAFYTVFESIKNYRGDVDMEEWIKAIVVNNCLHFLKSNKQTYWIVNTINAQEASKVKEKLLADDEILNKINSDDMLLAIQQLSPAYRAIYNMFCVDRYTHKQISEKLDVSEETSKSDLAKAKYNLRKNLVRIINDKPIQ